ncbi:hypothetical protein ACFL5O_04875 [Myxococcota bacterium]
MTQQRELPHPCETMEERLERLSRATAGIRARSDFVQRVMRQTLAVSDPGWLESAVASARAVVALAILAAAAALTLAVHTERMATEASAVAYTAEGLDW